MENLAKIETKSFSSLSSLREHLEAYPVTEGKAFPLRDMKLTSSGTVSVRGWEYPLTRGSLQDVLSYAHVSRDIFEKYSENGMQEDVISLANQYFTSSSEKDFEVKLIAQDTPEKKRIILGVPSSKYTLFPHSKALDTISSSIPSECSPKRIFLNEDMLEISVVSERKTTKDYLGEILQSGLSFFNSEGTRTCSLSAQAFVFRLVCMNGATAKSKIFSYSLVHRGNVKFGDFRKKASNLLERGERLLEGVKGLGEMEANESFFSFVTPQIEEAVGKKEGSKILEMVKGKGNIWEAYNVVTDYPKRVAEYQKKLALERVGFSILEKYIS